MKIREIRVQNFRNFGPELRSVKFYDEATGLVRPLSVLVGSNGCGKTTLLEFAVDIIASVIEEPWPRPHPRAGLVGLLGDALKRRAELVIELALSDDEGPKGLRPTTALGLSAERRHPRELVWKYRPDSDELSEPDPAYASAFHGWVERMVKSHKEKFQGGLIYLPHNRWMEHVQKGSIEEPKNSRRWLYRFTPESKWEGSLSQLWVWQNYLDLEQGREGRPNLAPFVETVEEILGRGRKVKIQNGRVRIERPDLGDSVELHQLPSGEQQILTIFGELIRMLRPGAVILIDEVEISLHPALQRAVLFHLRRLAAKYDLQIIVTTHSMEIVSAVAPEEVINLDDMAVVEQSRAPEPT